jgi:DNA-binding HxlR family transcriptional regulator
MPRKPVPRDEPETPGRYAYEALDRILHEKARLGILVSLSTHPAGLRFGDLKALCALTDGNLNRHLEVLEKADLVVIEKGWAGKRPQTSCRLTVPGRQRLLAYIAELERVVKDAAGSPASAAEPTPRTGFASA